MYVTEGHGVWRGVIRIHGNNYYLQQLMIRSLFLFGLIFFKTLVVFSQEANWEVYLETYEKGVGSTIFDKSYKAIAPLKEYKFV